MEKRKVIEMLEENYHALTYLKGHNKSTVKTCILLLNELPQELVMQTRANTTTPHNAGDLAEIVAGYLLQRKDHYSVSLNGRNDLDTIRKNEVKLCYSNNRPSNDIEDKGHYMIDTLSGKVRLSFVPRKIVRECKEYLIKGKRGGRTYAQAVISKLELKELEKMKLA